MNQRDTILAAWESRRAENLHSPQLKKADAFFDLVAHNLDICWEELVDEFRANYYDAYDLIVPVLFETGDPLIIHNFIRFSDLNQPKEIETVKNLIDQVDPARHEVTLMALAEEPKLQPALKRKAHLSKAVRAAMGMTKPPASETKAEGKKSGPKGVG